MKNSEENTTKKKARKKPSKKKPVKKLVQRKVLKAPEISIDTIFDTREHRLNAAAALEELEKSGAWRIMKAVIVKWRDQVESQLLNQRIEDLHRAEVMRLERIYLDSLIRLPNILHASLINADNIPESFDPYE